jgi:hypothetical protein
MRVWQRAVRVSDLILRSAHLRASRRMKPRSSHCPACTNTAPRSRGAFRPRFASSLALLENRGRREDRVRAAPAVSCAMCTRKCAHEHTGSAGASRPSLRSGFTAYNALSPVIELICHRRRTTPLRDLTPASGARTTRLRRTRHARSSSRACRVHRISPHVRDDRDPPLVCRETREERALICPTG